MRCLVIRVLLLVAATPLWAQSLPGLNFLQGVWALDNNAGGPETVEFHWSSLGGNPVLAGRQWTGRERACIWCAANTAMVAWFDPASQQIRVHLADKRQHRLDFHLVSLGSKSAEFLTDGSSGRPAYRLTYRLSQAGALSSTLAVKTDNEGNFVPLIQASFHRR